MIKGTLFQVEDSDLIFIERNDDELRIKIGEVELSMSLIVASALMGLLSQAQPTEPLSSF